MLIERLKLKKTGLKTIIFVICGGILALAIIAAHQDKTATLDNTLEGERLLSDLEQFSRKLKKMNEPQ
jgi:hypothetical protein